MQAGLTYFEFQICFYAFYRIKMHKAGVPGVTLTRAYTGSRHKNWAFSGFNARAMDTAG